MAHIAIIIAPKDFRDEEYFEPKKELEMAGHTTITASKVIGTIQGSRGKTTTAQIRIHDITPNNYDAILLVGGSGSYVYDDDAELHHVLKQFADTNKYITAICHAPVILAKAGVFVGKNATVFSGDIPALLSHDVHFLDQPVVTDGFIITANGPSSATAFGRVVATALASE